MKSRKWPGKNSSSPKSAKTELINKWQGEEGSTPCHFFLGFTGGRPFAFLQKSVRHEKYERI